MSDEHLEDIRRRSAMPPQPGLRPRVNILDVQELIAEIDRLRDEIRRLRNVRRDRE